MSLRNYGLLDRVIGEIDKGIKTLTVKNAPSREAPGTPDAVRLEESMRAQSARLMRVNHAGEVAAQGLYQGQALTARSETVACAMQHAAREEADHLAWCQRRLDELEARPSVLNPLWYASSFALGAIAGLAGDAMSLGFVAETELQVETHLRSHLERLAVEDVRTRAILEQMTHDEMQHGDTATSLGAKMLPSPMRWVMRSTAKLMTQTSYWV